MIDVRSVITSQEDMEVTGRGQVGFSRAIEIFCLDFNSLQLMGEHNEDLTLSLYVNYSSI